MLIFSAAGLQLAFPSAADRWFRLSAKSPFLLSRHGKKGDNYTKSSKKVQIITLFL